MRVHYFIVILFAVFCGCSAGHDTPHLQGGSWSADRFAAQRTSEHLQMDSQCRAYTATVLDTIVKKTSGFDASKWPQDARFYVRIEIHPDGSIGNVAIGGYTNAVATPLYIRAIKDSAPLPKWPANMRSIVGQDYWVMYIHTGFNMTPPGPD